MGQVKPDFSQAADFSPIPNRIYNAVVEDAEDFIADNDNKTPMIKITYNVLDSAPFKDRKGHDANTQGRKLFRNYPLAGRGSGFLRLLLEALKVEEDKFTDTKMLIGKRCKLQANEEEYEGVPQSRVKRVLPV